MRSLLLLGCLASLLLMPTESLAQFGVGIHVGPPVYNRGYGYRYQRPYYAGYHRGYYGGYHASTAAEGYQRGMASVLRAQGQKNLADAEAATRLEDARSKYLDNRVKATETFYERKRLYNDYTEEQRYKEAEKRDEYIEKVRLKSLTPEEFDATTGQIAWPTLLRSADYAAYRELLDLLFAKRAETGALDSNEYIEAKRTIRQWRYGIDLEKNKYPKQLLSDGLRFLLKLNRELDENLQ